MIRALLTALALLCAADRASALTDMPFNPHPVEIDYAVTMNFVSGPSKGVITITHHAGWIRVDRTVTGINDPQPITTYYGRKEKVSFRVQKYWNGGFGISVYSGNYDPLKYFQSTGERQTLLGEQCGIWRYNLSSTTQQLKCVTDDGIELSNRFVSNHNQGQMFAEAVRIERRAVDKAEVHPPREWLDLEY